VLLVVQLLLGGLVSSQYAGLACSFFPTCVGISLVPQLSGLVGLHVLHRVNSLLLVAAFGALCFVARGERVGGLAWLALRLLLLQVGVGAVNVLLRLPVELTALHTAIAAAISLVTVLSLRELVWSRTEQPAGVRSAALEIS